jgi:hypothetical protein
MCEAGGAGLKWDEARARTTFDGLGGDVGQSRAIVAAFSAVFGIGHGTANGVLADGVAGGSRVVFSASVCLVGAGVRIPSGFERVAASVERESPGCQSHERGAPETACA